MFLSHFVNGEVVIAPINQPNEQCSTSPRNTPCKSSGLPFFSFFFAEQFADDCQSTHLCQLFKPSTVPSTSQSNLSCLCVHSSTSSVTASPPLIFLRGSWFCMLEESPRAVKTVTRVNLSVSLKNRLLGDITLPHLVAHWLGAVSLDPAASHFIPIYHRGAHSSSHTNWLLFFCLIQTTIRYLLQYVPHIL